MSGRFVAWMALVIGLLFATSGCDKLLGKGGSSSSSASVQEPVPVTSADPPAQKTMVVDITGRPLSFAPLVEVADPAVALVRVPLRGGEGLGTAFMYDADGYLLTNHHVIEKAKEIQVTFKDGRSISARLIGSDKRTDVAVLKVEGKNLPLLPLGNSDETQVGDWVVAIGNPFGLSHSVSAGILSAKGRSRDDVKGLDPTGYFDFMQTDASINPGNSGGPLINLKGEVIAINTAIRANANGIGFAIPINMVKDLLPTLLRDGKIVRSAIGVIVEDIGPEQAPRLNRPDRKGAWVKGVQTGGPADKAGITVDDVIVAFNGKPVEGQNQLRWYASVAGVGQQATLRIVRGPKQVDVKVTLVELPEEN